MFENLTKAIVNFFSTIFSSRKNVKLGIYGPPNGGKTTLANRICKDWTGTTMGSASPIPHETREVKIKEKIEIKKGNKRLSFNLVDTPGIATKIDYEDFLKYKMGEKEAKSRAKEATRGVIESINGWITWIVF